MDKGSFTIRPVQEQDCDDLARLLRDFTAEHGKIMPGVDEFCRQRAEAMIAVTKNPAGSGHAFVAVSAGKPVAFAYVSYNKERGFYDFSDLYTDPAFEHQGIATSLIDQCKDFVRQRKGAEMYLDVSAQDKGVQAFYKKRGWVQGVFNEQRQFQPEPERTDPYFKASSYYLMQLKL